MNANESITLSKRRNSFDYAHLLGQVHELIAQGNGDSAEADAIADLMDAPWHVMTPEEQARMRGLSMDLYALREGGPKRVDMTEEQRDEWKRVFRGAYARSEVGDIDELLKFLRQPIPSSLPGQFVPFLQARCWEKLGDLETALVFMKEADRLDREQALSVLLLLQQLGRVEESRDYALRVCANPASPPLELYLACVALIAVVRQAPNSDEARFLLKGIVAVLERALERYLALPREARDQSRQADALIALALGVSLDWLGKREAAIKVYSEAIARHPDHGELFVSRALARYEDDLEGALSDFQKAAGLGVDSIWPYLVLAKVALQSGSNTEALRLALAAERCRGPDAARAEAYEIIAIANAELGQPPERVLENLDKAMALDPDNARVRKNREIATNLRQAQAGQQRYVVPGSRIDRGRIQRALSFEIESRSELYSEKNQNRIHEWLAPAYFPGRGTC